MATKTDLSDLSKGLAREILLRVGAQGCIVVIIGDDGYAAADMHCQAGDLEQRFPEYLVAAAESLLAAPSTFHWTHAEHDTKN